MNPSFAYRPTKEWTVMCFWCLMGILARPKNEEVTETKEAVIIG